jgi:hypothetical protein
MTPIYIWVMLPAAPLPLGFTVPKLSNDMWAVILCFPFLDRELTDLEKEEMRGM